MTISRSVEPRSLYESGRKLTAELELLYIENELTGRMSLKREEEDDRGTGIPITLSRT